MKFYQVEYISALEGHHGYKYFANKREAEQALAEYQRDHGEDSEAKLHRIEITPTKDGILDALNHYAQHPDNG